VYRAIVTYAMMAVGLLGCFVGIGQGQDVQLLPCAQVSFFAPACVPVVVVDSAPAVLPEPPPEPLFSRDTVARDTPPLMLQLLEEPTVANAQKFLAWQAQRQARISEVQQLLKVLSTEGKR
jgi:hypothetical protein